MKKHAAFLLACLMVCALLPAAQADTLYGAPNAYEMTGAYGASAAYGLGGVSAAPVSYGMTGASAVPVSYGMTGASAAAYGADMSVSCGIPAGYGAVGTVPCAPVPSFKAFKGFVNGYRINVRSCPGTSSAVCGVVSYGDAIYVTNYTYVSSKLWYYGSIGSLCGWIFSGYVGGAPLPACQTPVTGCAVPSGYGTICMNATNFRSGPGLYYASLMQLSRGTRVQLLCAVTDVTGVIWYQVLTSGCTGWVRSDLITTAGCSAWGIPAPYTAPACFTGYTNTNAVNVRTTPNGSVITQVSRGTTVYVYGIVCHRGVYWYQVRFYGGVGYIRADLVSGAACPAPACPAPACGGVGSGVNYYDYSDNSTTIITESSYSAPSRQEDGYTAPSYGYGAGDYGYTAPSAGSAWGNVPSGEAYGAPDTGDFGYGADTQTNMPSQVSPSLTFTTCSLTAGQTLPVYSAPNAASLRADSGTAQVTLTESLYTAGFDGQWLLVMYRNQDQMTRVGYVNAFQMDGTLPNMASLSFSTQQAVVTYRTAVTSDPMEQTDALVMLNSGDRVTFLATLSMNGEWAYVETLYNGVAVRGFVPADAVR